MRKILQCSKFLITNIVPPNISPRTKHRKGATAIRRKKVPHCIVSCDTHHRCTNTRPLYSCKNEKARVEQKAKFKGMRESREKKVKERAGFSADYRDGERERKLERSGHASSAGTKSLPGAAHSRGVFISCAPVFFCTNRAREAPTAWLFI